MVGAAERLVFEGPPEVVPPLRQDAAARKPTVVVGDVVDSVAACPPLSIVEQQRFDQLKAQARVALAGECAAKRAAWIASRTAEMVARTGMTVAEAAAVLEKQADGLLLSSVELEFDDPELAGATVGDVLDDPTKYAGETLADPIEGRGGRTLQGAGDDRRRRRAVHQQFRARAYDLPAEIRRERGACAACGGHRCGRRRWSGWSAWPNSTRSSCTALVQEAARRGGAGVRDIRALLKVAAKERARAPDCGGTRAGEGRTQRPAPPDGAAVPRCRVAAGDWRARRGCRCRLAACAVRGAISTAR